MKPLMVLGLVLIILGALALAYQGISYTKHEKIIDIGPLEASADTKKTLPLPPLLGGLVLGVGIILVIIGRKKS